MEVRIALDDIHEARFICMRHWCALDYDPKSFPECPLSVVQFRCPKEDEDVGAQRDDSRDWFLMLGA
jgi:hypothetical protein